MFFNVKTLPLAMQFHFLIKFTTNSQINFWIKLKYNFDFSILTLKLAWLSVKAGMGKWGTEWGEWGGGGKWGWECREYRWECGEWGWKCEECKECGVLGGNAGNLGENAGIRLEMREVRVGIRGMRLGMRGI